MRPGLLKHYITLQIPSSSKNAMGEWVTSWSDWVSCHASIEPNSGKMFYEAMQANSEAQGKIRIRFRTGVQPTMRVKYGQRIFKILSIVQPGERRRELHLMYKEELD